MMSAPLPEEFRREAEAFFRADFSEVCVHEGPEALRLGALAFAAGSELFFAPGHFQPDSRAGRRLLAHELMHVLQQRAGRVPHDGSAGPCLVEDFSLEAEAERAADAFVRGLPLPELDLAAPPGRRPGLPPVLQAAKVKLVDPSKTSYSLFKNEYEKYLYDYTLIQNWLTDPKHFVPALQFLDSELKKSKDVNKKLTNVLLKREQFYGINRAGAPIYTAVLSGPEFVAMNRKGVLPKDHVTPDHGEFTHRLHWYIVLYKATNGFIKQPSATFYNSVLNLLMKTTSAAYKPPKGNWPVLEGTQDGIETPVRSMWEALFDRRPMQGLYTIMEDWITCPEMFTALLVSRQVEFNPFYRKAQENKTLTKVAPLLSAEVTQRYSKRQTEIKDHGGSQSSWAEWYTKKKAQKIQVKIQPKVGSEDEIEVLLKESDYEMLEYDDKKNGRIQSKAVLVRRTKD